MSSIEQAAQVVADEAQRQGMTADDLWERWMENMDEIPERTFEASIDVTLAACRILEEKR